jgi:hypothetical protein
VTAASFQLHDAKQLARGGHQARVWKEFKGEDR